ncbi:MAG: S24 family peptidase [Desulfovibrionaceae bacterium]|nr:helix-turn-helix domain-containing protein [Desulfovibrionaceae bacterium]MDD4951679.1 S24 family peptidase [Desulfovibrionaceae bacterium]
MPKTKKKCDKAQEQWFEAALERIKKSTGARTQVQLAEVLNVRQSSISDAKRRCSIPAEWFLKLYRSHGLDPDWLADGIEPVYLNPGKAKLSAEAILKESPAPYGKLNSRSRVVQVSTLAGDLSESETWRPDYVEDLSIPESCHRQNLLVVKVDNSSMEPMIFRGAFVGVDQEQRQHPDGDICAIHFPHQGLLIRRVYLHNSQFTLRAENPKFADLSIPAREMNERIIGRVIWVLQHIVAQ